jgi:hypothetical protein
MNWYAVISNIDGGEKKKLEAGQSLVVYQTSCEHKWVCRFMLAFRKRISPADFCNVPGEKCRD